MSVWTRVITKHAGLVLAAGIVAAVVSANYGLSVFGQLKNDGFDDPKSSSAQAKEIINSTFGQQRADLILLFTSRDQPVTDPVAAKAIQDDLEEVRRTGGVEGVTGFFNTGLPSFVSRDQRQTFAVVRLEGDDHRQTETYRRLRDAVSGSPEITIAYGGAVAINEQISHQISQDLKRAEMLSFPVLAVLLLIAFRSVIAALVPLVLGGLSIVVAFLIVRLLTNVTEVSVYAINIITLMGLGLAIDYSLFIVSRFREELAAGRDANEAVAITLRTAGRTVLFSALTVILSLMGLLVFPQSFLRSMGLGGAAAVAATAALALSVLPAGLKLLGRHINALALPGLHRRLARPAEHGIWYRYSHFVMRHPLLVLAAALELLAVLTLPFLTAAFAGPDATSVPKNYSSRQVYDQMQSNFDGSRSKITLVAEADTPADQPATQAELAGYLDKLKDVDGVGDIRVSGRSDNLFYVTLAEDYETQSTAAQRVVRDVRAVPAPAGWQVETGGVTATLVDLLDGLKAKLPLAALIIMVATSVLMFLMLGSVVMPLKAVILNVLSLSAAFGVLAWVFRDGRLDATQPVLIFAIAFGLAMDYELFLLSRIKEEYDRTGDNANAVAVGVERTAGIITSAALMLVVVIGLFATGEIGIIQQVGVGLGAAVAIDATLVRMVLVPAAMKLLGHVNWWAPRPLARLAERLGVREGA